MPTITLHVSIGWSRRCNFSPCDKGQCPHGALFHAVPWCWKCFQQCRIAPKRLNSRAVPAIRHCWKDLQLPGTAWKKAPWGHYPLSQGAKLHRLDRPYVACLKIIIEVIVKNVKITFHHLLIRKRRLK